MAPGDGAKFPSFKGLRCVEHFDAIAIHMPPNDAKDLALLLTAFGLIPKIFLAAFLRILEIAPHLPDFLGGAFLRFLRLGLRGIVWSLYYSGWKGANVKTATPLEALGYHVQVKPR